ncbi:MAG: precorrin-8X methylmutase [Microcoleaceae cyanobacterium]
MTHESPSQSYPKPTYLIGDQITQQSFQIIDQEIGRHHFSQAEYAIVQRIIHATADFEFAELVQFSSGAIAAGISAIKQGQPVITDVSMVERGIAGMMAKTFKNPVISAIECAKAPLPGKTRTATGMMRIATEYPQGIFVIGNAPTALLALCSEIQQARMAPALVVGVPVGFVSVVESKAALAATSVAQIRVEGRKGGSAVAAAIINALIKLAWQET